MTTDEARAFADQIQERCDAMGDRAGESVRLGQCISIIRGFAATLDDPDALAARIDEITAQREAARLAAEGEAARLAAEADGAAPAPADTVPPAPRLDE